MKILLSLAVLLSLLSCAHHNHDEEKNTIIVGKSIKAKNFSNIYFSPQPNINEFSDLKAQGFKTIINLRAPEEYNEKDELQAAESNSFNYINLPFPKNLILTDKYIKSVTDSVAKHRKEGKILIHCSSGNRVGIWVGGHFYKDHGLDKKASLEMAKRMGLSKRKAINKLNIYFNKK